MLNRKNEKPGTYSAWLGLASGGYFAATVHSLLLAQAAQTALRLAPWRKTSNGAIGTFPLPFQKKAQPLGKKPLRRPRSSPVTGPLLRPILIMSTTEFWNSRDKDIWRAHNKNEPTILPA